MVIPVSSVSVPVPPQRRAILKANTIPYLPITVSHEVLVTPEGVWDAMLNQTDLGKNANKCATPVLKGHSYPLTVCYRFYLLQLLHPIGNNASCILHTRWGRVGENGQSQQKVCHIVQARVRMPLTLS